MRTIYIISKIQTMNSLKNTFFNLSWVVFSGIWVEAPLLLQKLPERWEISTTISFISQFAQIGPILLFFFKCKCISCFKGKWAHNLRKKQISDRIIVYMLFFIGLISGVVMALFWDKTCTIFGKERSVVFLSCVFSLAILDCTCTIAFLTYIGSFKGNYVTALYIGEGISSLLPSLFALAQGTGDDQSNSTSCNSTLSSNYSLNATTNKAQSIAQPRFSVSTYFWLLFGILVVSFCAFLMLDFWPSFQKEKKIYKKQTKNKIVKDKKDIMIILNREVSENLLHERRNNEDDDEFYLEPTTNESNSQKRGSKVSTKRKQSFDKFFLLVLITLVSFFIYGFLPGLSSYSAMPYGSNIMHFCSTLSKTINIFHVVFRFYFRLSAYLFIFLF